MDAADRLARQLRFIIEADKLKEVFRQSLCSQSRRQENDAEHSWHLALLVITLAEHSNVADIDIARVLKMVILHDLVEIDAGDTFAYDTAGAADQREREAHAADRIFGLLPEDQAADFRAIWEEFEARETAEARFASAVDRFQPMLLNILTEGTSWKKHGITHDRVIARNRTIVEGSEELWRCMSGLLDDAVVNGYLRK